MGQTVKADPKPPPPPTMLQRCGLSVQNDSSTSHGSTPHYAIPTGRLKTSPVPETPQKPHPAQAKPAPMSSSINTQVCGGGCRCVGRLSQGHSCVAWDAGVTPKGWGKDGTGLRVLLWHRMVRPGMRYDASLIVMMQSAPPPFIYTAELWWLTQERRGECRACVHPYTNVHVSEGEGGQHK